MASSAAIAPRTTATNKGRRFSLGTRNRESGGAAGRDRDRGRENSSRDINRGKSPTKGASSAAAAADARSRRSSRTLGRTVNISPERQTPQEKQAQADAVAKAQERAQARIRARNKANSSSMTSSNGIGNSASNNANTKGKHRSSSPSKSGAAEAAAAMGRTATVSATGIVMTKVSRSQPELNAAAVMSANVAVLQDAKVRADLGINVHGKCLRHPNMDVYQVQATMCACQPIQICTTNAATNADGSNTAPTDDCSAQANQPTWDPIADFTITPCRICASEEEAGGETRIRQRKSFAQVIRRIQSLQSAGGGPPRPAWSNTQPRPPTAPPHQSNINAVSNNNTNSNNNNNDKDQQAAEKELGERLKEHHSKLWWKAMLKRCDQVHGWALRQKDDEQNLLQQRVEEVEAKLVAANAANESNNDITEQYNRLSHHFQSQIQKLEQVVDHVTMEKDATISGLQAKLKAYEATIERQATEIEFLHEKCDKQEKTISNELRMIKAIAVKRAMAAATSNSNHGITAANSNSNNQGLNGSSHHSRSKNRDKYKHKPRQRRSNSSSGSNNHNANNQSLNRSSHSNTQLQLQQPQHPGAKHKHALLHQSSSNFSASSDSSQTSMSTKGQDLQREFQMDAASNNNLNMNLSLNGSGSMGGGEAPPMLPRRKVSEQMQFNNRTLPVQTELEEDDSNNNNHIINDSHIINDDAAAAILAAHSSPVPDLSESPEEDEHTDDDDNHDNEDDEDADIDDDDVVPNYANHIIEPAEHDDDELEQLHRQEHESTSHHESSEGTSSSELQRLGKNSASQERLASLTPEDLALYQKQDHNLQQQQQQNGASMNSVTSANRPPPPPPTSSSTSAAASASECLNAMSKSNGTLMTSTSTYSATPDVNGQRKLASNKSANKKYLQRQASKSEENDIDDDDEGMYSKPASAKSFFSANSTSSKRSSRSKRSVTDGEASPKPEASNKGGWRKKLQSATQYNQMATTFEPSERPQRRSISISIPQKSDSDKQKSSSKKNGPTIMSAMSPYASEPRRGIKQVFNKMKSIANRRGSTGSNNSSGKNNSKHSTGSGNINNSAHNGSSNSEISFTPEFPVLQAQQQHSQEIQFNGSNEMNYFHTDEQPIQNDPLLKEAMKEIQQNPAVGKTIMEEPEDEEDWDMSEAELGGVLSGQQYLEVNRGGNISPVSALTTGSYLLDKGGKMMDDENDGGPHKGLREAAFTKRLPLEEDFISDDDEDEDGDEMENGDNDGDHLHHQQHLHASAGYQQNGQMIPQDNDPYYGSGTPVVDDQQYQEHIDSFNRSLGHTQNFNQNYNNRSSKSLFAQHQKSYTTSPQQQQRRKQPRNSGGKFSPNGTSFKSILSTSGHRSDHANGMMKSKVQNNGGVTFSHRQPPQPQRSTRAHPNPPRRTTSREKKHKRTYTVKSQIVHDKYGDGGEYTGTVSVDENLPHGYGKMQYENDRQYEGDWKDGRWHGFGRWMNPNGDCYEGTFVYDARHGSGTYTWKNGNVYEGDFFEDKRQGNGKFLFANGNTYDGEFVNGVFEGLGRYEFEGGFYEGQWKSGRYHGKGLLLFTDGSSYKGDFKDGVAHGRGQETDAQGGIRSGYWKEGIAI